MIKLGTHPDIPEAELQAYLNHANNTYPHRDGVVNIALDGDYVDQATSSALSTGSTTPSAEKLTTA